MKYVWYAKAPTHVSALCASTDQTGTFINSNKIRCELETQHGGARTHDQMRTEIGF